MDLFLLVGQPQPQLEHTSKRYLRPPLSPRRRQSTLEKRQQLSSPNVSPSRRSFVAKKPKITTQEDEFQLPLFLGMTANASASSTQSRTAKNVPSSTQNSQDTSDHRIKMAKLRRLVRESERQCQLETLLEEKSAKARQRVNLEREFRKSKAVKGIGRRTHAKNSVEQRHDCKWMERQTKAEGIVQKHLEHRKLHAMQQVQHVQSVVRRLKAARVIQAAIRRHFLSHHGHGIKFIPHEKEADIDPPLPLFFGMMANLHPSLETSECRIKRAKLRRLIQESQRQCELEACLEEKFIKAQKRVALDRQFKLQRVWRNMDRVHANRTLHKKDDFKWLERVSKAECKFQKNMEQRKWHAMQQVQHAQSVFRKVRAVRTIQASIRRHFLFSGVVVAKKQEPQMTQVMAATLIQRHTRNVQMSQKLRVAQSGNSVEGSSSPLKALQYLVDLFSSKEQDALDSVQVAMQQPKTLTCAQCVLSCLEPSLKLHQSPALDERLLLTGFLIANFGSAIMPATTTTTTGKTDIEQLSALAQARVEWGSKQLFRICRDMSSPTSFPCPLTESVGHLVCLVPVFCTWFKEWKELDKEVLVQSVQQSAQETWVIYLHATACLDNPSNIFLKEEDRIKHEASKKGSREHIKRIRIMLNKVVGSDRAVAILKKAKKWAHQQQQQEQDVERPETILSNPNESSSTEQNNSVLESIPDWLESNESLVHRILLTDPEDFYTLTWDGSPYKPCTSAEAFLSSFWYNNSSHDGMTHSSFEQTVDAAMRRAYWMGIVTDLQGGKFHTVARLLNELCDKIHAMDMRGSTTAKNVTLLNPTTMNNVLELAVKAANILSTQLESPARSTSTLEWMDLINNMANDEVAASLGMESLEHFVVASLGFLMEKTDMCKLDIINFRLIQVAPLIQSSVGLDYERRKFAMLHGFSNSPPDSVDSQYLKEQLKHTWEWIRTSVATHRLTESHGSLLATGDCFEARILFMKTRAFVDGLLFYSRGSLNMPEILELDRQSILEIRQEAKCLVIASALALHASNAVRVGTGSIFNTSPLPNEIDAEKEHLKSILLGAKHEVSQEALVEKVSVSVISLAKGKLLHICYH
eukprot:scaffold18337_cov49-Attheya_sp.AAC.3